LLPPFPTLKMIPTYQTTRRHITEDLNVHVYHKAVPFYIPRAEWDQCSPWQRRSSLVSMRSELERSLDGTAVGSALEHPYTEGLPPTAVSTCLHPERGTLSGAGTTAVCTFTRSHASSQSFWQVCVGSWMSKLQLALASMVSQQSRSTIKGGLTSCSENFPSRQRGGPHFQNTQKKVLERKNYFLNSVE
jgi:hypothetical protein